MLRHHQRVLQRLGERMSGEDAGRAAHRVGRVRHVGADLGGVGGAQSEQRARLQAEPFARSQPFKGLVDGA